VAGLVQVRSGKLSCYQFSSGALSQCCVAGCVLAAAPPATTATTATQVVAVVAG